VQRSIPSLPGPDDRGVSGVTTVRSGRRWRAVSVSASSGRAVVAGTAVSELDVAVAALLGGSESAFVQVYRAVQPGLLRYLSALVGDQAEDVAQEAWAQACRDLHQFGGDGSAFRGWLTTIGRNRAVDHLRAQRRRPVEAVPVEDFAHVPGVQDTAGQAVDAVSTQAAIALIATLPAEQAEAVLLRAVMGLDAKRAGQVMGKRAGAVRTLAYRGLQTLAGRIDADLR
jgi:RNA polymerase sigma-70 factor (ECF subfamily)